MLFSNPLSKVFCTLIWNIWIGFMVAAVFYHKPNSVYDDLPDRYYHFPKQYLSRVEQVIGQPIVYYGPLGGLTGRFYWAAAIVTHVRQDLLRPDHFYADLKGYIDFDRLVGYQENGGFEHKLILADGKVNGGRAVQAVRVITDEECDAILRAGMSEQSPWPERYDEVDLINEFDEAPQTPLERPFVEQLVNRRFRDVKFRQHIRVAYDRRCAFTGLRLINGKGRPEVEAAHIMPVEENGPDSVQNGIALSGTVHWMFDRGLLSLDDDYTILKSRQLNHDVSHLLRPDMKAIVPENPRLRPHPYYLDWHRTNCFKAA
ncbi:HNH endonuclease [uncultured Hoeflea sp.]|uniref:HNH endonuclease n=1 Tax=uncultured Hoeflea sp. TaxID=538666 RepID=UPI0030DBD0E6